MCVAVTAITTTTIAATSAPTRTAVPTSTVATTGVTTTTAPTGAAAVEATTGTATTATTDVDDLLDGFGSETLGRGLEDGGVGGGREAPRHHEDGFAEAQFGRKDRPLGHEARKETNEDALGLVILLAFHPRTNLRRFFAPS